MGQEKWEFRIPQRSAPETLKNRQENRVHRYYPGLKKKDVISMKRLWQKHKKKVFGSFAFLMFFLFYGTVGAVECDTLTLYEGTIRSIIFLALLVLFTYLAGGFEEYSERRDKQKGRKERTPCKQQHSL